MRTQYATIKYQLEGLLQSDEPLLEGVLILAPAKDITSLAHRMGMKVWIQKRLVINPVLLSTPLEAWWTGIKTLPERRQ